VRNGGTPPTLLGRYEGADGKPVEFWDLAGAEPNYLAFQFGRWAALVYDYTSEFGGGAATMTDAERAAWSRSLAGVTGAAQAVEFVDPPG
jgi:hypothetical protein